MTHTISQASSRPLSPHLQVYKWHLMMAVSILHRITGVALVAGTLLLIGWLWAAAYDAVCFKAIQHFLGSVFGRLVLFGWSLAFYFHLCNGIRHLVWDMGKGFEVQDAERSAWAVVLFGSVLTLLTWLLVLTVGVK